MVIDINLSIGENLDIIFCLSFHAKCITAALIKPTGMGTLVNFIWVSGAAILPLLNVLIFKIQNAVEK